MSKVIWFNEYELIEADLTSGAIEVEDARHRMRQLGFDCDETENHIHAWRASMGIE